MKSIRAAIAASVAVASLSIATPAFAGIDEYIGEIMITPYTFCPRDSLEASGQTLSISSNTALFALIGTTYGGNGSTTFALPDLRGRVPIHIGQGPGLSNYILGQAGGTETNTLSANQMPVHSHSAVIAIAPVAADSTNPRNNAFAPQAATNYSDNGAPDATKTMHPGTVAVGNAGGGQPFNNIQPYLALRFCMVQFGIFPSRP